MHVLLWANSLCRCCQQSGWVSACQVSGMRLCALIQAKSQSLLYLFSASITTAKIIFASYIWTWNWNSPKSICCALFNSNTTKDRQKRYKNTIVTLRLLIRKIIGRVFGEKSWHCRITEFSVDTVVSERPDEVLLCSWTVHSYWTPFWETSFIALLSFLLRIKTTLVGLRYTNFFFSKWINCSILPKYGICLDFSWGTILAVCTFLTKIHYSHTFFGIIASNMVIEI